MTEIISHSQHNPEFNRIVTVAKLRGMAEFPFDLSPTPDEAAALARLLGARAIRKMRFAGRLISQPNGAWRLEAELGATVTQSCVVTLDPVTTRIDVSVRRRFEPGAAAHEREIVIGENDDDETEALEERIDLGLVATESLALALPAYPRREGASLGAYAASAPPGATPLTDAEVRPFSVLSALRGKAGGGA